MKDDLDSLSTQLSQKNNETFELNTEKNTLLEKIKDLEQIKENEITELNTQIKKFQEELSEGKVTLQNKDDHINSLQNTINELEKKSTDQTELQKLKDDLDSLSTQLSQKNNDTSELNNEKNTLLEKINVLEQIIKENENQGNDILQELKEELNNSRFELEESKNNVAEKEKIIDELRNDLVTLESTKSEVIKILTVAKKSYQEKIKIKDEQLSNLRTELEQLKKLSGENQGSYKIENQVSESDLARNEPTMENDKIEFEKNGVVTPDNNENVFDSNTTNEHDEILSKSQFIASASSDSFNDDSLQCLKYNDIYIVNINLSRATVEDAKPISKFLLDLINSNKDKLVVNLTKCEYIDSSVLGALVNALKKVTTIGGDLRIAWPNQGDNSMLHLTRMDKVFQIFSSLKDAVESYQ